MRPRLHFVEDYRALVADLIHRYPLTEAMSRAVGGNFDAGGEVEKQLLIGLGLKPTDTLIDVGCGSGRLARALDPYLTPGAYVGTDVVQELLDYARSGAGRWRYALVEDIGIPEADASADFVSFFSVFTHLLYEECYCYLLEARRVLKSGGCAVFSFLEYPYNWEIFQDVYTMILGGGRNVHLHTFIGRDALRCWAEHLGMEVVVIHAADEAFIPVSRPIVYDNGVRVEAGSRAALGQSLAVLRKP